MAMRSQVYEWSIIAGNSARGRASGAAGTLTLAADTDLSIFIGGKGNNITKPAETTATQFIVIEDVACSPQLEGAVQVRINTTDYFLDPDGIGSDGVPGTAAPYPKTTFTQGNFNLYPTVYVLPGQTFDVRVTYYNSVGVNTTAGTSTVTGPSADKGQLQAFVKYTLYDGPDALIANKLLEMGVSVNPGNVDWYKRSLLEGSA